MFFLFVFITQHNLVFGDVKGPCVPGYELSYRNLKLGLPPDYNGVVSGYLPSMQSSDWLCQQYQNTWSGEDRGIWNVYGDTGQNFALTATNIHYDPDSWSLLFTVVPSTKTAVFKVCKWPRGVFNANNPLGISSATTCMYNVSFTLPIEQYKQHIVGITWSGSAVRLYLLEDNYLFDIPNKWGRVSSWCATARACALQSVDTVVTYNVVTATNGSIIRYDKCGNCTGYPQHVFSVPEDGKVPMEFGLANWFMLTNSSTLLEGKVVSKQPLLINCLWPVPQLLSTGTIIYFNGSANDVSCNGYNRTGLADALRFSLNFTNSRPFTGVGSIVLVSGDFNLTFSCSNSSDLSTRNIPLDSNGTLYYCYVSFNGSNTFVGMLPPVVKEIVISRYGGIYVNGYRVFQYIALDGVVFNVSASSGADIWTVAFAVDADVMLEINATNIQRLMYCDTPINLLKCQHLQFQLSDGFYPAAALARDTVKHVFVDLPRAYTHSYVNLFVSYNVTNGIASGPPTSFDVRLIRFNESEILNVSGTQCVSTTQFSTNLTYVAPPDIPSWVAGVKDLQFKLKIVSDNCPFNFDSLNNYLSFDSLCFSTEFQAGACMLKIVKVWSTFETPFASLYVSYKSGNRILGVPTPKVGVFDISDLTLDACVEYTIYGISGRGIIVATNATYLSGLYYVSNSGMLLGFKNATTGAIYAVTPCDLSKQVVVYNNAIIGAMTASRNDSFGFNNTLETPMFYYHSARASNCTTPVLTYSAIGICADGSIINVTMQEANPKPVSPTVSGNISIPVNFSMSVQAEYVQITMQSVSVDCPTYVCNGNPHCLRLLSQYATACQTIEDALRLSAKLEALELTSMLSVSKDTIHLATIAQFNGTYNLSSALPPSIGKRSAIEDLLFDKVVTNGLGTVDQDYKNCVANFKDAQTFKIMTHTCAQYYNGIMVVPGVADKDTMGQFTASLVGGLSFAFLTSAAAYPFAQVVQARLNYVAMQTDVLQQNQQQLASSFNAAMGNITDAFREVNTALQNTHEAIKTVATALNKIESVVNQQGLALTHLTQQLASNFEAISASIEDIYNRLDVLEADAQVDRLISGRLAALNAFVAQQLTKYTEIRASRQLAQEKVNECVKSQSKRFGFCGNGTHVFSLVNAAPDGLLFLHTVLVPTAYAVVDAWAGLCMNSRAFVLRDVSLLLFVRNDTYFVTPRDMYEPRTPLFSDFIEIATCDVSYLTVSSQNISTIIPDYLDVNKTLQDMLDTLNSTRPPLDLQVDKFNLTFLNLSQQIADLENRSAYIQASTQRLDQLISNINNTLVDLEWLNRVETYIKWPWYIWLAIALALIFACAILFWCCVSTGCCGCCSCMSSLDLSGRRLQHYEVEKVHIQ
uniref:Spike protein n=1 Tax=Otomops bat coronavirus TaxID=3119329 RepID=A0AB38ZDX5_9NIDO